MRRKGSHHHSGPSIHGNGDRSWKCNNIGVVEEGGEVGANVPLPNAQNSSNMSYIWASGAVIVCRGVEDVVVDGRYSRRAEPFRLTQQIPPAPRVTLSFGVALRPTTTTTTTLPSALVDCQYSTVDCQFNK